MSLITFVRLVWRNLRILILFPVVIAVSVLIFTSDMPKTYQSHTVVYTGIASGFDITSDEDGRIDYFAVNNAFDNLITTINARETLESMALKLLAQHLLLEEPRNNVLRKDGFNKLQDLIPDSLRKQLVVPNNHQATYYRLLSYQSGSVRNVLQDLLASDGTYYSISRIRGEMKVKRVGSSDMIEIQYTADDPGVVQHSLFYLADTFMERYKGLKGIETQNVIEYFERELRKAFEKLQKSEEELKVFGTDNRIINYYEQAKFIAEAKEDLDVDIYVQKRKRESALKSIERLEKKLDIQLNQIKSSKELTQRRQELSEVSLQLSNAELFESNTNVIDSLTDRARVIREDIQGIANRYYTFNYSIEGVPIENLLTEWLDQIIGLEEATASLQVYEGRKTDIDSTYDTFAPLGSTLSKLEREVGINEKQYLSVLHGLNLARLRQQNLQFANTLSILDSPFFPINPQPSKRGILILASGFAGGLLLLALLVARELLDQSVRSPQRVTQLTGLSVVGALPWLDKRVRKAVKVDELEHALLEQAMSAIHLELNADTERDGPHVILLTSVREEEGKTWVGERLVRKLTEVNGRVLWALPHELDRSIDPLPDKATTVRYPLQPDFVETADWKALLQDEEVWAGHKYLVIELPPLATASLPAEVVQSGHLHLWVMDAKRVWTGACAHLLDLYQRAAQSTPVVFMDQVHMDELESLIGALPKHRSKLRKRLRQWFVRSFSK